MNNKFIIYNKVNRLYWNNHIGWTDRKLATKLETKKFKLFKKIYKYIRI